MNRTLKNYLHFSLLSAITESGEVAHSYTPDGEPRIPKIGEVIKINGKFHKVSMMMKTKRQVYR